MAKIITDSRILGGKPVISGTRISVEFILELLSSGWTYDQIVKDYKITKEDIIAAINFARESIKDIQEISLSK